MAESKKKTVGEKPKVQLPYKKGDVICDIKILDYVKGDNRPIKFIQLAKEKRPYFNPETGMKEFHETGKIITIGSERSMTLDGFEDFIKRRKVAGQTLIR